MARDVSIVEAVLGGTTGRRGIRRGGLYFFPDGSIAAQIALIPLLVP
jgi:hypothetical protein